MSNTGQNIIFLVGRSDDAWQISLNGGKMLMNRFSIDEDAAFELSGVYNLWPIEYPIKGAGVVHLCKKFISMVRSHKCYSKR